MNILSFNTDFEGNTFSDKDVLSEFKQHTEKIMTIHQGMSVKEISDIVSDNIIALVKQQFQTTKEQFQANEKM